MTDIRTLLPSFPTATFGSILAAVDRHALTTTDILTIHPADLSKQTRLPLLDLKRFIATIQTLLYDDLQASRPNSIDELPGVTCISTLDHELDAVLGGGVPTGRITEFAGESGAGKTQFLLSLCLSVQLPPPHGLGKKALYISTESGLATSRLAQMLRTNEILRAAKTAADESDEAPPAPSLDNILSTALPDLESQDHILHYQVPVLLERHNIGLIVLDSVAANYRAEFERGDGKASGSSRVSNMAARSAELIRLGALLRDFARRHNLAVVTANQVADRFSDGPSSSMFHRTPGRLRGNRPTAQGSPLVIRHGGSGIASSPSMSSQHLRSSAYGMSQPFGPPDDDGPPIPEVLLLDHQQRWFTGWGDDPYSSHALKTPSLGLVWSTQIACRVALFKRPVYGRARVAPSGAGSSAQQGDDYDPADMAAPTLQSWRRWMKVVFAPHTKSSTKGMIGAVEFEITSGGLKAVSPAKGKGKKKA